MHVTLVAVDGTAEMRRLHIELPAILGRSRQADLTIAHLVISRKHCELREHEGVVYLEDLGSLNGTFCRDRRIQRVPLLPNDRFSIGPVTFEIDYVCDGHEERNYRVDVRTASDPPPIVLPEPVKSPLVELDDPIESSGTPDHRAAVAPQTRPRRKQRLAGFTHREADAMWSDRDGHQSGELIEIHGPQPLNDPGDVTFDAPTSQSPSSSKDRDADSSDRPDDLEETDP